MKRVYDQEARLAIIDILQKAIKAVRKGLIADPGDLGGIAADLRDLAMEISENSDDDTDETYIWFVEAFPLGLRPNEVVRRPFAIKKSAKTFLSEIDDIVASLPKPADAV